MKKAAAVFSIMVFTVMLAEPGQAWAAAVQIPLPQSAGLTQGTTGIQQVGSQEPVSDDTVGVACAVGGTVTAAFPGQAPRSLKSGMPVSMGETIETGADGRLQLLLKDETAFTLGPNSRIVVDDFVYDESSDKGRVEASITKGVFRFITGKIAKKKPSSMTVKLPSAVIGVRGTIVAGQTDGQSSEVILLGPGEDNNTGENPGSIHVSNEGGGEDISRSGYGTFVEDENTAPTDPAAVPEDQISEITDALNPSPEGGSNDAGENAGTDETASDFAGQNQADSTQSSSLTETHHEFVSELNDFAKESSLQSTDNNSVNNSGNSGTGGGSGGSSGSDVTSMAELQSLTGTGSATLSLADLTPNGSFTLSLNIDFSDQTLAPTSSVSTLTANSSNIASGTPLEFNLTSVDYTSSTGNAVFTYTSLMDTNSLATADITLTFNNNGTTLAHDVDVNVTITDISASDTVTGSGNTNVTVADSI